MERYLQPGDRIPCPKCNYTPGIMTRLCANFPRCEDDCECADLPCPECNGWGELRVTRTGWYEGQLEIETDWLFQAPPEVTVS